MSGAHVSGVGLVAFGRYPDTPLAELGVRAARRALVDAGIEYADIGEVFAASSFAPPQTGLEVAHALGRTGVPVTAVESASASGAVAFRHAVEAVRSGRCDAALAVGYEKTTALEPGGVVPVARTFWDRCSPYVHYAIEAARFVHDHGCGPEVFATVAAKDHNAAAANPMAARRADHEITVDEVLASKLVASPLTRMMCHTSADGAAAIVVTGRPGADAVEVRSVAQSSWMADPAWPESGPVVGPQSQNAATARLALDAAEVDRTEIGIISIHDLCASEELTTLVAIGLVAAADAADLVAAGGLGPGGELPTNLDGGCVARGHAFGATGLVQIADVADRLRGRAGGLRAGARVGLAHAVGGGGSCVVTVLGR